jgi:very-short-patch-repair endonuclease
MPYSRRPIQREMYYGAKPELFRRATTMLKNPTESEKVLWCILKKYRKKGFIFRQQHPINNFIADFYCHKLKLVLEVDGGIHTGEEAKDYDDGRTAEMERFGIKVIRFTNDQVLNDQKKIINQIEDLMK